MKKQLPESFQLSGSLYKLFYKKLVERRKRIVSYAKRVLRCVKRVLR